MKKTVIKVVVLAFAAGALTFVGGCSEKQKRSTLIGSMAGVGLGGLVGGLIGKSAGSALAGAAIGGVAGGSVGAAVGADDADNCRACRKGSYRCKDKSCHGDKCCSKCTGYREIAIDKDTE